MRLDKFLKVSRVIKRRTIANEACDAGRVTLNDRVAKAGSNVKSGDVVSIRFGDKSFTFRILNVNETAKKDEAGLMYEIMDGKDES